MNVFFAMTTVTAGAKNMYQYARYRNNCFLNKQEPQRLPAEYISRQASPTGGVEEIRTISLGPFAM